LYLVEGNTLARMMDELGLSLADVQPQVRKPVQSETFSFLRKGIR